MTLTGTYQPELPRGYQRMTLTDAHQPELPRGCQCMTLTGTHQWCHQPEIRKGHQCMSLTGAHQSSRALCAGAEAARRQYGEETAGKLLAMLQTSAHLDIAALQRKLPDSVAGRAAMHVRALLHERLQQHAQALEIYVDHLNDFHLAEAYADRLYTSVEVRTASSATTRNTC